MKVIKSFGELRNELFKTLFRAKDMDKHEVTAAVESFAMECAFYHKTWLASVARTVTKAMEDAKK